MSDNTTNTTKKATVTLHTAFIDLGDSREPEAEVFGSRKEAKEYLAEILEEQMEDLEIKEVMDERLQNYVAVEYNGEYYITERTIQVELRDE